MEKIMAKRLLALKDLNKMEPAKARVLVAKDVIAAVKAKEMVATPGSYIELPDDVRDRIEEIYDEMDSGKTPTNNDARKVLGRKRCGVCAVGAAAVGLVKRFDQEKITKLSGYRTALKLFPYGMLHNMETAFEVDHLIGRADMRGHVNESAARKFGVRYKNPNARLEAIFQNIIDNDGDFKP